MILGTRSPSGAPSRRRAALLVVGVLVAFAGCASEPPDPEPAKVEPAPLESSAPAAPETPEEEAIAKIRSGDLAGAHRILVELLLGQHVARAQEALDAGSPEDALIEADEALELDLSDPAALRVKARGSLQLAEKHLRPGGSASLIEGSLADAKRYYRRLGEDVEGRFGESRAALLSRETSQALRLAREGQALLETLRETPALPFVPERIFADAAWRSYYEARLAASEPGGTSELSSLFVETEDALARLLGRTSDDPWTWQTLSDLYEWEGMHSDARGVLERALARLPGDAGLLERLARVTRAGEGASAAAAVLASYNEKHPGDALGLWHEGIERFEAASEGLLAAGAERREARNAAAAAGPDSLAALPGLDPAEVSRIEQGYLASEALLRRSRAAKPEFEASCRGFEVMCRDGIGWIRYHGKDYRGAIEAFLSMNEVVERGIEWQLEGRLLSGVLGLEFVGAGYNEEEKFLEAAEVNELLMGLRPNVAGYANNVGFFLREAAVALEFSGRLFCRASRGEIEAGPDLDRLREEAGIEASLAETPEERGRLEAASNAAMERARELIGRSLDAYLVAARLAPEDVRIVNDTALVIVYYTHDQLDLAEELLLRCVKLGEEQLADSALAGQARMDLNEAWGDAHQNLGVLAHFFRNDSAAAVNWFERSVEIGGPRPRVFVTNVYLPLVKGELAPELAEDARALDVRTWASPCSQ